MADADRPGFARSRLVRETAREDAAVRPEADDPEAGLVLIAGERVVLSRNVPATAVLSPSQAARTPERAVEVRLGRLDDRPVFAAAIAPEAGEAYAGDPAFRLVDLRGLAVEGAVAAHELGLLAAAKSLLAWHARHGFCARCGAATEMRAGGYRRACLRCGTQHFPRTDPVVIMLVARDGSCLLGRAPHFPASMYSCLAGFVEPGETIEDAVRRETREETGIAVGAVRYRASQPWPFPSSLMIGCVAEALSTAIATDPAELDDARWFTRDAVGLMIAGGHPEGLSVPPPMTIAHLLMRDFVDRAV